MITKPTYYKREIYIAHASPSITDNVKEVEGELESTIEEYEREALMLLGYHLAIAFISNLDITQSNGLKGTADAKWDELLNGHTYTSPSTGKDSVWRGIRFKSTESQTEPDMSLLAYFVYYFWQSNDYITIGTTGAQIEVADNAERVVPTQKVINALRKFAKMLQGGFYDSQPKVYAGGLGVDYYGSQANVEVSLFRFVADMNIITPDYYEGFEPKKVSSGSNQFGI